MEYLNRFDYQQKIDMIYSILEDSKRVLKEVYRLLTEIYKSKGDYKDVSISHIGNAYAYRAGNIRAVQESQRK